MKVRLVRIEGDRDGIRFGVIRFGKCGPLCFQHDRLNDVVRLFSGVGKWGYSMEVRDPELRKLARQLLAQVWRDERRKAA